MSSLSLNQKLTLLIAVVAIVGGIVAAFVSGHDWFSPKDTTLPTIEIIATSTETVSSSSINTVLPSKPSESGKVTLTICNHYSTMSGVSKELVVQLNNNGFVMSVAVPIGNCVNIQVDQGVYDIDLFEPSASMYSAMDSTKKIPIDKPTCILIAGSRLEYSSIDKCSPLP